MADVERLCELFADQFVLDTVAPETDFLLAGGRRIAGRRTGSCTPSGST